MRQRKTKAWLPVLVILIVLGALGTAYAGWKVQSSTINKISMASISGIIDEEYVDNPILEPGLSADKVVKVTNNGEIDSLIRVKVTKAWGEERDEDGRIIPRADLSADNIEIIFDNTKWLYRDTDGWFYYKEVLKPGNSTIPLMNSYKIRETTGNEYKGMKADIHIRMECIQAGSEEAKFWGTSFKELGIQYEREKPEELTTTVEYIDGETEFEFNVNEGDLFANFKKLLPGESRSQRIDISNQDTETAEIFFWAEHVEQSSATPETIELINDLLKKYVMIKITDPSGRELYDGPVWGNPDKEPTGNDSMKYPISLGNFTPEETKSLMVSLYADKDIDNKYQSLIGDIKWVFAVEDDAENPEKDYAEDSDIQAEDKVKTGDRITYEIKYFNHHEEAADILIRDRLDKGFRFIEASGGGTYNEEMHTVNWKLEGVTARTRGSVFLTVEVTEDAVISVENDAWVQIGHDSEVKTNIVENPVDPEDPDPEDPDPVDPEKDTARESEIGEGETVKVGDRITYRIRYYNHETQAADVIVRDKLDKGVDFVSASHGGVYDKDTHTVTWTIKNVPSGTYGRLTLTAAVNEDAVEQVENQAVVKIGNNDETETDVVIHPVDPGTDPDPDPEPEKDYAKDSDIQAEDKVKAGDRITYEIKYFNHHEEAADILIRDRLDKGFRFIEASGGGTYNEEMHTVNWKLEGVTARTRGSVFLTVEVTEDAVISVENDAWVQIGHDPEVKTNIVENPVDPEEPGPIDPVKDIPRESSIQEDQAVKIGDVITYRIRYFNHEQESADVRITDKLDKGVDFVHADHNGSYGSGSRTVTWNIKGVPARSWGEVILKVKVNEAAAEQVENQAVVKIGNHDEVETDIIVNPVEEDEEPKEPEKGYTEDSDIQAGDKVKAGDHITYEIKYYNHHANPADVIITDRLDKGVKFISADNSGTYEPGSHTVTWVLPDRKAKSSGSVTLVVEVTEDAVHIVENDAKVSIGNDVETKTNVTGNPVDPDPEDPDPVDPEKVISRDSNVQAGQEAGVGDRITYQIRYYNHEAEPVTVKITDQLDKGVDFVSASDGGVYDSDEHTVVWTINHVKDRTYGSVDLTVEVNEDALHMVENEAEVKIGGNDPRITQKVKINITEDKEKFRKTPLSKDVRPGQAVGYEFTGFGNSLKRPMKKFSITDIFPEGLHFESASVPAFTKGQGLLYDITYITNKHDRRTLHAAVPADQAFSFKAPALENGEWIMYLTLAIDEVPVGFGTGDSIVFNCRVGSDVKSKELVNEAVLGYDGVGIAGEVEGIRIDSTPRTGDQTDMRWYIVMAALAALVAAGALYMRNKKRVEKEHRRR